MSLHTQHILLDSACLYAAFLLACIFTAPGTAGVSATPRLGRFEGEGLLGRSGGRRKSGGCRGGGTVFSTARSSPSSAKVLGVSVLTLYRWARLQDLQLCNLAGKLPASRIPIVGRWQASKWASCTCRQCGIAFAHCAGVPSVGKLGVHTQAKSAQQVHTQRGTRR